MKGGFEHLIKQCQFVQGKSFHGKIYDVSQTFFSGIVISSNHFESKNMIF